MTRRALGAMIMAAWIWGGCAAKGGDVAPAPVVEAVGYGTMLYGQVKAGQGSGVVGVPLDGVEVTLKVGEVVLGPVLSEPSGSFTLDAAPFFPPEVVADVEGLGNAPTVNVEVHMSREGFIPGVEIVTFPVERYREFTFYLKGDGS